MSTQTTIPTLTTAKQLKSGGGIVRGNHLLHFLDFSFYFFCSLGIELFFIGGKLAQQSHELSSVYKFLVRYFLEHFRGELVVGGLGKLHVQLSRFVLCGHHEANCSDELLMRELPVVCQP